MIASYRIVLVGDASMSPYEIEKEGGSVERWNDEPGEAWLRRLLDAYPKAVWLNPVPEKYWTGTASIGMIRRMIGGPDVPADPRRPRPGDAPPDALDTWTGSDRAPSRPAASAAGCRAKRPAVRLREAKPPRASGPSGWI